MAFTTSLSSAQLDAFFMVSQTKNFSRAAEKLLITQSALSQRIMNLESELGTSLFIRDRAGLQLTEIAHKLLRYYQTKSALEDEFFTSLNSKDSLLSGIVRIGSFSSIMRSVLIPSLADLLRENSGLRLNVVTRELRSLPDMLRTGEIDFMVLDYTIDREDLASIELGQEVNILVESKLHKSPDIYLDHDEHDQITLKYLKATGKKASTVKRRYLDDVYGLIDGVKLGLGRAVLPKHLVAADPDLRILDPQKTLKLPVVLHFYHQPYYTKLHQAVVHALTEQSKRRLLSDLPSKK